jgi:hypothetical protein
MNWRLINDEAKSGAYVLLWAKGWEPGAMGMWNSKTQSWDDGDFHHDMGDFTHWMPFPSPPMPQKPAAWSE